MVLNSGGLPKLDQDLCLTVGLKYIEDEVIVSNMERPGSINPRKLKEKRYGIKIREVPFGLPPKRSACAIRVSAPIRVSHKETDLLLAGVRDLLKHRT